MVLPVGEAMLYFWHDFFLSLFSLNDKVHENWAGTNIVEEYASGKNTVKFRK